MTFFFLLSGSLSLPAQEQQAETAGPFTALKANLAASQAALRHYQWIETTVVSLNGEEKSSVQKRCYYGADGVLQKVEVAAPPPEQSKPGIRGRVIANKKAELTGYMQNAVALVRTYVPPDPAKLQDVKDAGDLSIQPEAYGPHVKLVFSNYEKPGDSLDLSLDPASNQLTGLSVATYLDDPSDAVNLGVIMAQLPDGTGYPSETTLDAPAKNLTVVVTNSGYEKTAE